MHIHAPVVQNQNLDWSVTMRHDLPGSKKEDPLEKLIETAQTSPRLMELSKREQDKIQATQERFIQANLKLEEIRSCGLDCGVETIKTVKDLRIVHKFYKKNKIKDLYWKSQVTWPAANIVLQNRYPRGVDIRHFESSFELLIEENTLQKVQFGFLKSDFPLDPRVLWKIHIHLLTKPGQSLVFKVPAGEAPIRLFIQRSPHILIWDDHGIGREFDLGSPRGLLITSQDSPEPPFEKIGYV